MRIYYSHPISDYGTPYETAVLRKLHLYFSQFTIENPNQPQHQQGYRDGGMDYFITLCAGCDGCIFDTFPSGIIGSGVAMEVNSFLESNKPVYQLHFPLFGDAIQLLPVSYISKEIVATRDTTRELSKLFKVIGRQHYPPSVIV